MPFDQAPQIETARGPRWELPEIKDVKIKSATFKPRAMRHVENPLDEVKDAVEIVVSLAAPMPIRALPPVLWVGGQALTESEAADKTGRKMRFWSFDRAKLEPGAPIRMSWLGEAPPVTPSDARAKAKGKFYYKPPK